VPLLLALLAPWFALITRQSHGAFWAEALGHDLGDKLIRGQEHHGAWPGTYLLELPLAFWPAAPLVLASLPFAWGLRHDPRIRFLLAAILPAWLVFECVPTKLPHYLLPLFPPLAVLAAISWREAPGRLWARLRAHQVPALAGLAVLALLANGIGFGLVLPRLTTPFIIREFVRHRAAYPADLRSGTVALAGFHEPSAVLYLGTGTELLAGPAAATALARGDVRLALITPDEAAAFANLDFTPVETIEGYNYAGGCSVQLTVYRKTD
jgi:4-amino-4-deoxy-L-arabinose transferase-like glycosyltransferase